MLRGNKEAETIPIPQKLLLTVEEAAAYSNIGINKLYKMMNNPICTFIIYVGNKKRLIKRKQFEEYISKNIEI